MLIAESRLAHGANDDPDEIEEVQLMTVLVSFDPTPAQRWSARALAGTYITAQCQFEQLPLGRDLAGWLIGLLNSRVASSMCLVWALPATDFSSTAQQIETVIAEVRNGKHHKLPLSVATALKPIEWGTCASVEGFIANSQVVNDSTALGVFNMLAALMAPGIAACFDIEDLRVVLGTYESPSRVVSGIWLEEKETFVLASDYDQQLLQNCSALSCIAARYLKFASQHKLLNAIRKSAARDCEIVRVVPYGLSSEPLHSDQIVPIFLVLVTKQEMRLTEEALLGFAARN